LSKTIAKKNKQKRLPRRKSVEEYSKEKIIVQSIHNPLSLTEKIHIRAYS